MPKSHYAIAILCLSAVSAWGQHVISARPGLVNYTEGDVQIDGKPVAPKSNGTLLLQTGQVLDTTNGKAEVLLTPGAFLRLGDHSAVRMVSSELTDTRVELQRGEALVEVAELFKGNQIRVLDNGASTTLLKKGLYRFDGDRHTVSVYDGKARVNGDDRDVQVGKGKEALLASNLNTEKFDRKKDTDPLYRWSEVRSGYLAEANIASARTVASSSGFWSGPGWYWNPYFSSFSFIPGNGILYSPFGFGFYSPGWVAYAPVYAYRPYPGGSVIAGRPLPPPRVIRPAMPAGGVSARSGMSRTSRSSAGSVGSISQAPAGGSAPARAGGGGGRSSVGRGR